MPGRVLHVLSQRPLRTGSGITLDALVRHASLAGWDQWAVVGAPADDPNPPVADLPGDRVRPVLFQTAELDFPVPGMSDVMPYESSRFSSLSEQQLAAYRAAWRVHLARTCDEVRPDVIHVHHVWLVSSLLADAAPGVPVVNHCHATGLRQMDLCPHLAEEVRRGCARNHGFVVLHGDHRAALQRCLGVDAKRISVVGAGYRDELFHPRGRRRQSANRIVYVGKLSFAKGLPWLLDAFERLAASQRASGGQIAYQAGPLRLHVVGSGAGPQAELLSGRIESGAPQVIGHGSLSQAELAELFRRCSVCVLPSFYEGLPLVVVEALACGCGVVASSVPGVLHELVPRFRDAIDVVELPRMVGPDTPVEEDLPQFVGQLGGALRRALRRPPLVAPVAATRAALARYTWDAVFRRVETVWRSVMP